MRCCRISLSAKALIVELVFIASFAVMACASSIQEAEGVFLSGGEGSISLRLATTIDGVAGVQGVCFFDATRLTLNKVTLGPDQPNSFAVKYHLVEPGEIRFIAYSFGEVFVPVEPLLIFHVGLKYPALEHVLESMLVVDLPFVAFSDGSLEYLDQRFLNVPISAAMEDPGLSYWLLY